ncbi:MAG: response regulator [Patescibacteria group bacterium]
MNKPPLILIVDDEPDFREIFSAKLSSEGFNVDTANDGEEGIQKAKKLRPDLVLMDVQMPGISGVEALIRIKEDPKLEDIPILFLTALGDPRAELQEINRRLSRELGAVGYVKKTEDLNVLVEYIRNFLQ